MRPVNPRSILSPFTREPWIVLGPLIVAQWIAVAVFAAIVRHNGWLFYQGGDQTFFYTDSWVMSHGHIPEAEIGYAWSYLLMPITAVFGTNVFAALPAIVLFQVGILLPAALVSVYGIASRCAGRLVGYAAATIWVFGPFIVIPLWDQRYHEKYIENFLPQALGLTGLGDFPSMVALLVSAYFCIRAIDTAALPDAALAGIVAGFAIGTKAANVLFLAAPLVGFLLARRIRVGLAFGVALVPATLTLALWKYRGLGHLPIITPAPHAGAQPLAVGSAGVVAADVHPLASLSDYLNLSWTQLKDNLNNVREFFWSPRLAEWVPIAGAIAIGRRSIAKAAFLGTWFGTFFFVKGASPLVSIQGGTFLRIFMPGFPPFWIFFAALPLLLPTFGPRLAERFPVAAAGRLDWRNRPLLAGVALLAAVPLLLVAVLQPLKSRAATKYFDENVSIPVDASFRPTVVLSPNGQDVWWTPPKTSTARVFYRVFRSPAVLPAPDPTLPPGHEGIRCLVQTSAASDCRLEMQVIGSTRDFHWHDPDVLRDQRWTYRVGVAGNWLDDLNGGDVLFVSAPVTFINKS
jgi:hypothetical protein